MNESESTLTQGTTSRNAFPSNTIFLLSFQSPKGFCGMRFSNAPSVHILFFVFLVWFLCFPIFSSLVCFDFFLMLTSFFFWKYTYLHYWAIQIKKIENSFTEMTAEKLYKHQLYSYEIYICVGCLKEVNWFRSLK